MTDDSDNEEDERVVGAFDPETKTIYLGPEPDEADQEAGEE